MANAGNTTTSTPLVISPLFQYENTSSPSDKGQASGRYVTLQRVVSAVPNRPTDRVAFGTLGEVETCLDEYVSLNGECLWRRLVVYAGPGNGASRSVHASYTLPSSGGKRDATASDVPAPDNSLFCWASFPERKNHKLLCVLSSSSLLCIWDVYPNQDDSRGSVSGGVGEGHSISLPFEARAVFPLGENQGLILQRLDTFEDSRIYESMNGSSWAHDDEEGVVLSEPPKPRRHVGVLASPPPTVNHSNASAESTTSFGGLIAQAVPSLFSLRHPLDEVLPLSATGGMDADGDISVVSDVYEKVLFVGTARWTNANSDPNKNTERMQLICVTYHSRLKRHAVWAFKKAPKPPPSPPLWEVSRNQRIHESSNGRKTNGVLEDPSHIADEEELHNMMGVTDSNSPQGDGNIAFSQQDALADILGVRPSLKVEDSVASRTRSKRARRKSGSLSAQPAPFLSPQPEPKKNDFTGRDHYDGPPNAPPPASAMSLSSFSQLYPDVAMSLLFEEDASTSSSFGEATSTFLASNTEGSGTLLLCLECPVLGNTAGTELRCFSLDLDPRRRSVSSVSVLAGIPCLSAQPIQCIPTCPYFRIGGQLCECPLQEPRTTDILIVKDAGDTSVVSGTLISLYRGSFAIVDCILAAPEYERIKHKNVVRLGNNVADRMDFVCVGEAGEDVVVRGSLSLALPWDCERLIGTVESALVDNLLQSSRDCDTSHLPLEVELGLKLRVDCFVRRQSMGRSCTMEEIGSENNVAVSSVSAVILSVLDNLIMSYLGICPSESEQMDMTPVHDGNADWLALLDSDFHNSYVADFGSTLFLGFDGDGHVPCGPVSLDSSALHSCACVQNKGVQTKSFPQIIFDSMHLLYEDLKLSRTYRSSYLMREVSSIVVSTCTRVDEICSPASVMADFLDHYRRDLGAGAVDRISSSVAALNLTSRWTMEDCRKFTTSFENPPCFLSWFDGLMRGDPIPGKTALFSDLNSRFNASCSMTRSLHQVLSILFPSQEKSVEAKGAQSQISKDRSVVIAMIENGMLDSTEIRDDLQIGLALPILETLSRCREHSATTSGSQWPPVAWSLIGRDDLARYNRPDAASRASTNPRRFSASWRSELAGFHSGGDDKDGIIDLEISAAMRFSEDNRVREAGRLLRSSRPSYLNVPRAVEISDHDYERLKQDRLQILCQRILALPVGRGMLTLGTLQPVPAEPLAVPELCLSGRVPPTNATLALDVSECPIDMKVWPEFHNGVAAGMRLPVASSEEDAAYQITRTWIAYNRRQRRDAHNANNSGNANNDNAEDQNTQADHVFGGLLLALGLRGHLSTLSMTDMYEYLTEGTMTTTIGILLGVSAQKRGSCDTAISKILCLHIPSLLPQSFSAIDVASPAQAAAVSGIGLLYQGSSHRLMTEFLLNEMARGPSNTGNGFDREAYSLSCGLALGMVNLSRGDQVDGWAQDGGGCAGLADLHIGERLHRFIVGGADDEDVHRRRESTEQANPLSVTEIERNSVTYEGGVINTSITAPGAILALGLMYLQSGNKSVASSLSLPDTHFLLEYVRPDLLLLRVIARSLILWDNVVPDSQWIEDQIPSVIRTSYGRIRAAAARLNDASSVSGLESSRAEPRPAGGPRSHQMRHSFDETKEDSACVLEDHEVDRQAVRQIYAHVVAGACFGIGLRFAGTGDKRAAAAIRERLKSFLTLRDDPKAFALKPESSILDTCMGCAAIALSMVMAGTGDLETLRVMKLLRWRCDEGVTYGGHMAYGAAIGLLFLGGGNCTLGREPADIAYLVLSFFPRFPSSSSDNKYHLQALRHCYALAVKPMGLRAFDVDTSEEVFIPVEVNPLCSNPAVSNVHSTLRDSNERGQIDVPDQPAENLSLKTPCLLHGEVKQLHVKSHKYFPLSLSGKEISDCDLSLFVKKRNVFLSSFSETLPDSATIAQSETCRKHSALQLNQSLAEDPQLNSFVKYLCDSEEAKHGGRERSINGPIDVFCTDMIRECLACDKEEAMPLYLTLRGATESLGTDSVVEASATVWDIRLIRTYYEAYGRCFDERFTYKKLLDPDFVSLLVETVNEYVVDQPASPQLLSDDARSACFLTWCSIPFPA